MSSILKVDQIQLADGTAPTAADLGFAAGSVIKTHNLSSPNTTAITLTSSTAVTVDSFNITTSGNSKLIWFFDTSQVSKSSASTNLRVEMTVDGNALSTLNVPQMNHVWYGQNAGREHHLNWIYTDTLSAGSHTINVLASSYLGTSITVKYQGVSWRYLVQEVAV